MTNDSMTNNRDLYLGAMKSDRRLAALTAICEAFLPSVSRPDDPAGYWARSAGDIGVADRILNALEKAKTEDRRKFGQLLDLLASPLLGFTWQGPLKPAQRLSLAQRTRLLQKWAKSPFSDIRYGYNSLRKLVMLVYYGDVFGPEATNPNWPALGYEPVSYPPQKSTPICSQPAGHHILDCDTLVIGSGAGGSVVAAMHAVAGRDVIVVDKGAFVSPEEMSQREFPGIQSQFEAGGLLTSDDGGITVLAGSTIGGGTTINWAASLRTPDYVLAEWAASGNLQFLDKAYQKGFEFIEQRNHINSGYTHNPQNKALIDSGAKLGWHSQSIPNNIRFPAGMPEETAWKALGFSCYGDRYGIKQGAVQTFLTDAVEKGARVYSHIDIQRITTSNGVATGAEGLIRDTHGATKPVSIRAKKVVVSAGALHTPVLLLKSGLTHPQIGRNLWLHPVAATAAVMPEDTLPWYGPMMTGLVNEFERLDGNWGVRIECPPVHPGLGAFALSWADGESFKQQMLDIRKMAVHVVLTRDRFGGSVTVGKRSGQPVIHYKLSDYDKKHLQRGLLESARLHAAAGAGRILVPHNIPIVFDPKSEKTDSLSEAISSRKWRANDFGLFTAHQMGTCRMGGKPDSPVKPNGETREVRNLYVADASLFPSASGVNPMLSVQALAYFVGLMSN